MATCPACSALLAEGALACEGCGALVHRERLMELNAASLRAEAEQDWEGCARALAESCALLPPDTQQFRIMHQRLEASLHRLKHRQPQPEFSSMIEPEEEATHRAPFPVIVASAVRNLGKGLLRPATLLTLIVWIAALSWFIGWKAALGFGLLIYLHEMGHLIAIQYYGYRGSWPIFIPLFGAFVLHGGRMDKRFENVVISMAGPVAGIAGSAVLFAAGAMFGPAPGVMKLAYLNLLINYLNLLPVWMLDGGRISEKLSRGQYWAISGCLGALSIARLNIFDFIMAVAWLARLGANWNAPGVHPPHDAAERKRLWIGTLLLVALFVASGWGLKVFKPS